MNNFKSHFRYTNRQRNGIFFLAACIIVLQVVYFFIGSFTNAPTKKNWAYGNTGDMQVFQKEIDSLRQLAISTRSTKKSKIYPFNPSFLTDYKGYRLGMSKEEIDRLLQYRANGNYINSAKEFQQVTEVSDSLLHTIEPYFKFPDWVIANNRNKKHPVSLKSSRISQNTAIIDLNSATAEELRIIDGIGEKLSHRIINYRNKLGGFLRDDQLYEVWYLDKEVADKVLERFQVIDKPAIKKINVNTATFKEVLSIVYIDYELTKKILNYRDEVAEIQTLDELKKIDGFPLEKFERIALYLEAK
ncbi:MAG TPA: helix-hairpin-helix domain-containing protein [Flavobacteriia bacterium]|nr:helix-hairpin-helix domain-containing protein [Flavobacteriia bacterium]